MASTPRPVKAPATSRVSAKSADSTAYWVAACSLSQRFIRNDRKAAVPRPWVKDSMTEAT